MSVIAAALMLLLGMCVAQQCDITGEWIHEEHLAARGMMLDADMRIEFGADQRFELKFDVKSLVNGEKDECSISGSGTWALSEGDKLLTLRISSCAASDASAVARRRSANSDVEVERQCECPENKVQKVRHHFKQNCEKLSLPLDGFAKDVPPTFKRRYRAPVHDEL